MQFQSHIVTENESGQRIDKVLSSATNESRNTIQGWINKGSVFINETEVKKNGQKVSTGDSIKWEKPKLEQTEEQAEDIPLDILYEDDSIIVINKAAGMVVHPDESGHSTGTVVNAILHHFPKIEGVGQAGRPGIVHRLDKDTSGVLLIAKTQEAHRHYSELFKERKVHKEYLALVIGYPKSEKGVIDAAVQRGHKHRQQMAIHHQGKRAVTHFEILERFKGMTLLKVVIETGRTHQIRLHLASIGHPIVGDTVYGDKDFEHKLPLNRQFLHAERLELDNKKFQAPLPGDLESSLEQLRED